MRVHPLQKTTIYGPVNSNRLSRSLGINLLPTTYKFCSFNCIYCVYGWTDVLSTDATDRLRDLPTPEGVAEELERALRSVGEIDYITFSGSGEPTLHPQFHQIVDVVVQLRNRLRRETPLAILSNSSMVMKEEVRAGIQKLDRRILKLDAGTEGTYKLVNKPAPEVRFDEIVSGLGEMEGIEIQTMFVENDVKNASGEEIDAWIGKLSSIEPIGVQLCSIHHPPADSSIRGLSEERLAEIAERVEKGLGIPARTY